MEDGYDLPAEAPGQYRPLRADQPLAKAYFPDSLPPEFELDNDLTNAVADAMHALGRLDGLASEVDNPEAVFSSFVYKEAESSSQVEGTAVTVSDIYRHDVTERDRTPASGHEQDVQEARNYVAALDEAMTFLRTAGFERENVTLQLVRNLHETLLESGRSEEDDPLPGEFRPGLVTIDETNDLGQVQVRFPPPKPDVAERAMQDLETYIQSDHAWPDLVDIALIHYQFETIHPFKDGNGRVGRLLIVILLVCTDLLRHPILYPSSYFRRRKDEYADRLLRVSEGGEWEEWIEFFLRGIEEQATEAFVRARLLLRKRHEYDEQYADAPTSVRRLVDSLFRDPYFTVNEAANAIDMTYGTANNAIERLEEDGILTEITGQEQYRVFEAEEIMDIVERPADQLPDPDEVFGGSSSWDFP
jgi:Fic family protein